MKHPIAMPDELRMKFFTPELYLRYNSVHDQDADRADEDWEKALLEYQSHLEKLSRGMPHRVVDLAEKVCLHDAELLSVQENIIVGFYKALPDASVAIISLRQNFQITVLIYFLKGQLIQSFPLEGWPFSRLRTHWLYDEIDLDERLPNLYWHRILLSDGRVLHVPFADVVIETFSENRPDTSVVSRKWA